MFGKDAREQFGIGGMESVRGFLERQFAGDRGYSGSLELYSPDFGADAIKIGGSAYGQNCARCHGLGAVSGGIAPDLRLLPTDAMLPWTLVLFALATALLLWANHRMRGNLPFVAAALWALAAVYVKQSGWRLPGSDTAALVAVVVALVLAAQIVWLRLRPQPRTAVG